MLDVRPRVISRNGYWSIYCIEDCIATIANYESMDYQMMFLDSFDFDYDIEKTKQTGKILSGINIASNETMNLLKYHGLSFEDSQAADVDQMLVEIKKEISQLRPVMVKVDGYYCPWDVQYQRFHNKHMVIVKDINEKEIAICDAFYKKPLKIIDMDTFRKIVSQVIRYKIVDTSYKKKDYKQIFYDYLMENHRKEKVYQNIKDFANAFEQYYKAEIEFESEKEYREFEECFAAIVMQRSKFFNLLNYMLKISRARISWYTEQEEKIVQGWVVIKNTLCKGYFCNDSKTAEVMKEKISVAHDLEEALMEHALKDIYDRKTKANSINAKTLVSMKEVKVRKAIEPYIVDVKPYVNNSAFGDPLDPYCESDFSGLHEFLGYEKISDEVKKKDYIFHTCITPTKDMDNISCMGQTIAVDTQEIYTKVDFLATSEFGESFANVTVVYEDGEVEVAVITLPDLVNDPINTEIIIWTGKTYIKTEEMKPEEAYKLRLETVHLYAKRCYLKKNKRIKSMVMPEFKNCHIFAITLH